MRAEFEGYYRPTDEQLTEIWRTCIFSLDANILLDLYRVSSDASSKLINILKQISERLRLTHQAGLEYQENRLDAINDQEDAYQAVLGILNGAESDLEKIFKRGGHLSIDTEALLTEIRTTFERVRAELDKQKQHHPDLYNRDGIRDLLTPIFEQRVGSPFSQAALDEICAEGEKRYTNKIPPGYKDGDKKGSTAFENLLIERKFGDLILWKQLLLIAKQEQKPVIFVTSDSKEDWWWEVRGKKIGPRPELVAEMLKETGQRFYLYRLDRFVEHAQSSLGQDVDQKLIDEVRDIGDPSVDWKATVMSALEDLSGSAHLSEIYDQILSTSVRKLPYSWRSIIRKTLQQYSSDTESYLGKEDLFQRLGSGQWRLRKHADRSNIEYAAEELNSFIDKRLLWAKNQAEVMTAVDNLRALGIPASHIHRRLRLIWPTTIEELNEESH